MNFLNLKRVLEVMTEYVKNAKVADQNKLKFVKKRVRARKVIALFASPWTRN